MNLFLFVFVIVCIDSSQPLRNVRLLVPKSIPEGGNATLYCLYELEGDPLYSVKWYRGTHEIYRYLPKEKPKIQVFPLPGLHIDLNNSNSQRLTLLNVPRHLGGVFSCEVSADEPAYTTSFVTETLQVIQRDTNLTNSISKENFVRLQHNNINYEERGTNGFQKQSVAFSLLEFGFVMCVFIL